MKNLKLKFLLIRTFVLGTVALLLFTNAFATGNENPGNRQMKQSAQQESTISGMVTDSKNEALIGVNVTIEGTTIGTVTDQDGKYTIKVPDENAVVVFSFIGFLTEKMPVGSQTVINMTLIEDIMQLSEVVVTALGIKKEKRALGYAISSVKGEELLKSGTPVNPLMSLYGKAAGVRIASTSGGPTSGMIINIRNSISLTEESNTRPLFVVDGVPIYDENTGSNRNDRDGRDRGTGINDINAEDIESVEILKGSKAAVLYGYAGANGVVLITTKTGAKAKGLGVDASISYTMDNVAFYPEYQNEFGSGGSVGYLGIDPALTDADGFRYEMINGNKVPVFFTSGTSFGPKMNGREILWYDSVMRPYSPQPDNYKDLFRTGHLRTANFAITNGGEIGSVRFSYTNKQYESVALEAYQTNHNFSLNTTLQTRKAISLNTTTNYYYTFNHNAPFRVQDAFVTYGIARDMKVDILKENIFDETGVYSYFRNREIANRAGSVITGSVFDEYLWNQTQNNFDETRHHLIQSAKLTVNLTKWLSFVTNGGFDLTRKMNLVEKKVTRPLYEDVFQGYYSNTERNILRLLGQASLNFNKQLTKDLELSGLVATGFESNSDRYLNAVTTNFLIENFFHLGNSTNVSKVNSDGYRGSDLIYYTLGSAQLNYKRMLYLELQGRNDRSSILPPQNNNYFYPGASLAWIVSESFALPDFFQYAKARVSMADVGRPGPRYFANLNFDVNSYGGVPYMTSNSSLPPADFASAVGVLPKENLKPERKREFEAGLEMYFLQGNRFGLDIAYFRSNTYNQILALQVPQSSGVSSIRMNAGDVQNAGVEVQLTITPVMSSNFRWDNTFNISYNKNKVNKLTDEIDILPLWGISGAKVQATVDGEYGEILINPWQRDSLGNLVVNSDGVYAFDTEKEKKVGVIIPKVLGGYSTNFTYKAFSLGMDFDFQFGGTLISQTNMYMKGNGTGTESLKYRDEARGGLPYYIDNDNNYHQLGSHTEVVPTDSKYSFILHDGVVLPGVKEDGSPNDKIISAQEYYERTYWQGYMDITEDMIFKSDYIALRRLTFSYNLPASVTSRLRLNSTRVTLFGANLAYLYKAIPNVTPESTSGTNEFVEYANMPGVRTFGAELRFSF